jgi:general secretion pathway protein M
MMKQGFFQAALPPRWGQQWRTLIAPLQSRWDAMAARERIGLSIAAIALGLLLVWQLGIASALRTLRDAPRQIDQLDAQLQDMRRQAEEAKGLRAVPAVNAAQASLALSAATERLGAAGKLSIQGEHATLTLTNVSTEQLLAWLGEARSAARARPIEAQLQRGPKGYTGTLSLSVGSL